MIEIDHVSFQYSGAEKENLQDFTLQISKGECVVLTGESGCGKTCVTRLINTLIPHFYEGELKGKISIDGVDWRFGLASLVGIILAFIAEFIGYGSGEMKENMGKYQTALEEMNNASVEYVRGMPVVKAFNQTASSFKKLKDAISGYTEWVLKFSLGWQNCMPAFTTIINNIYLILIPVGILIGSSTSDFAGFAMSFIFYLLFVPAIAGVLNKIMYISESFMQINGNVARMDEILNIPEMPETDHPQILSKILMAHSPSQIQVCKSLHRFMRNICFSPSSLLKQECRRKLRKRMPASWNTLSARRALQD